MLLQYPMEIEFDPEKSAKNERERGLPFDRAAELDWDRAIAFPDERRDYGEGRIIALAPMQGRLYAVCYVVRVRFRTDRAGGVTGRREVRRIISFRKANDREEKIYDQTTADR